FFFQAEDGIRYRNVTGVQTCALPISPTRRWPPLVPERRGDSVVVRFSFEGAKAVAIAGDWNAWQPVPLRPLAGDEWEGAFLLESGLYHFNLLVEIGRAHV